VDDIRTATLLFNLKELGISKEVLCKAAQLSEVELAHRDKNAGSPISKGSTLACAMRRAISILVTERQLRQTGGRTDGAVLEVQVLGLAEEYEALVSGQRGSQMSPTQAGARADPAIERRLRFAGSGQLRPGLRRKYHRG
jgi:hypothetical protein